MNKIYTIGRDPSCDIVITDNTDVVSRVHASLKVKGAGKYVLVDQGRNGTYVNGIKMSPNEEIPVTRKDMISFAHVADLDWSKVPKEKSRGMLPALIAFIGIAVVGTALYFVMRPQASAVSETECEEEPSQAVFETSARNDTVRDTVFIKEAPKPAPPVKDKKPRRKENSAEPSTESPAEETVIDAIY